MAAKIKDGLFIGDAETSQSELFINDNKISNLINCAGREVSNHWASHGLVYLTYYWEDRSDFKLFTGHEDHLLRDIVEFIEVSITHGISVLLFSKKGTGRCVVALCVYLMMKYRWGFEKTYDFVYSKKPDIELNKGFIQQMFALDMKLLAARQRAYSLKHGIPNEFKIEANMTINDIAAMLPVNEAKRWNAWDIDYLIDDIESYDHEDSSLFNGIHPKLDSKDDPSSINRSNSMDSKSTNGGMFPSSYQNGMKRKESHHELNQLNGTKRKSGDFLSAKQRLREDTEEELILVNSFINSKNTITALPGPYRNVYDIPKSFKLKFDNINQEEDIHMFPTSPSSASRLLHIPKGILKGIHGSSHGSGHGHHKGKAPLPNVMKSHVGEEVKALDSNQAYGKSSSSSSNSHHPPSNQSQAKSTHGGLDTNEVSSKDWSNGNRHAPHQQPSHPQSSSGKELPHSSHTTNAPPTTHHEAFESEQSYLRDSTSDRELNAKDPRTSHHANNNNNSSNQSSKRNNDLYNFVGISHESNNPNKTNKNYNKPGSNNLDNSTFSDHGGPSNSTTNANGHQKPSSHSRNPSPSTYTSNQNKLPSEVSNLIAATTGPQSAEERLRKLMSDMQRQNLANGKPSSANGRNDMNEEETYKKMSASSTTPHGSSSNSYLPAAGNSHTNHNPSLYDLANIQLRDNNKPSNHPTVSDSFKNDVNNIARIGIGAADYELIRQQQQQLFANRPGANNTSFSGSNAQSNVPHGLNSSLLAQSGGAVRARHDVITNNPNNNNQNNGMNNTATVKNQRQLGPTRDNSAATTSNGDGFQNTSSTKIAWGMTPNPTPSNSNSNNQRYVSPTNVRGSSNNAMGGGASSNVSVTSVNSQQTNPGMGSGGGIYPNGTAQGVGNGSGSGSRVYRHGSPAPNSIRPSSGSKPTSGNGLNRPSSASSNLSNSLNNNNLQANGSNARSNGPNQLYSQPQATPLRKVSSNASINSLGSASNDLSFTNTIGSSVGSASANRRKPSPLRASTGTGLPTTPSTQQGIRRAPSPTASASFAQSNALSTAATANPNNAPPRRRFMTPTPQSNHHHEYDNGSIGSGSSNNNNNNNLNMSNGNTFVGSNRIIRTSTPTRSSWKF